MKALIRSCAGLLCLLAVTSSAHPQGRIWVSPVFKTPLPSAPSPSNSGFYYVDAYGRLVGPHYYLVPPFGPFNGILPGKTGEAIMAGNLPHTLLLSKEGKDLGKVPMLKKHNKVEQTPYPTYPWPSGMAPMMGGGMPATDTQVPYYASVPRSTYPMASPYAQPMAPPVAYAPPGAPYAPPVGYAPNSPYRPVGYVPYYGPPGAYAMMRQDPQTGIWQVQNIVPGQGATPFMAIPGFGTGVPTAPAAQGPPMDPRGGMPFEQFGPFDPFGRMQGPQPPRPDFTPFTPMQLPRMDMQGPPPMPRGIPYPTHPFTRSPRDFFMWSESMDEERARGNRPFPVP